MAANRVRTFSLNFVALQVGTYSFDGFAEGDAMTIAYAGDDFEVQQGSDGEVLYVQKHNRVADLTIRLTQGNPLVQAWNALHQASLNAGGATYAFNYADLKGTEKITGSVMIKKFPDAKAADTGQPKELMAHLTVNSWAGGEIPATV